MSISLIVDAVMVAVVLLSVVLGAKRGLFRSFAGLVVLVVALLVATQAAELLSGFAVERLLRPGADAAIREKIEEMLLEEEVSTTLMAEMQQVVSAIPNQWIRTYAQELLNTWGLSTQTQLFHSAAEVLLGLADQVLDAVLDGVVHSILYSVLFLIAFALVSLVLKGVVRLLDLPFHLPVLRQINGFGGLLFGAAKGVLLVWVCLWFLLHAELLITREVLDGSLLLRHVVNWFSLLGFPVLPVK